MKTPKVSVIILNWNKLDYLKQCIENAVKNTDYLNYEIIIFDNASIEKGTKEYLSSLPFTTVFGPVNLRFAKGNNEAIKYASGDYLLFLNNDTVPEYDWLSPMVQLIMDAPECGIVGSKLLYPDRTIQHIGMYIDFKGRRKCYFKQYPEDIPEAVTVRECELVSAACMLIKKSLFEKVGKFDERYIHGVEDVDLCLKVRELGYKILFCPKSVLIHFEGTSLRDIGKTEREKIKNREKLKKKSARNNERIFYKKWGNKIDGMRLEPHHSKFKSRDYFDRDYSGIVRLIPGKAESILYFGFGKGFLGKALKNSGVEKIYGIEIDSALAIETDLYLDLDKAIKGDFENISIKDQKNCFDCIVLTDILEHLKDPWISLRKLKELLSEEGMIIASITNIRHYSVIKDIIRDRWFYREDGILDSNHIRFFGLSTIKHLFSTSGLDIIGIERLEKAERFMQILNRVFFNNLREFITSRYLILAKKKKQTSYENENSPEL